MAKQVVSVRVSDEVLARVEEIAARTGENRSECMERLVKIGAETVLDTTKTLDGPIIGKLIAFIVESPTLMKMVGADLSPEELEGARKRMKSILATRGGNKHGKES